MRHPHVTIHAATDQEAQDVQRELGKVRVLVRPNDAGPLAEAPPGPPPAREIRAVFLGRLVPIKGLYELLTSLRDVERPLSLDIYGPAEDHRTLRCAGEKPTSCRVSCGWISRV